MTNIIIKKYNVKSINNGQWNIGENYSNTLNQMGYPKIDNTLNLFSNIYGQPYTGKNNTIICIGVTGAGMKCGELFLIGTEQNVLKTEEELKDIKEFKLSRLEIKAKQTAEAVK